jgi:diguanylate cyclase (GGDEF)-like protein
LVVDVLAVAIAVAFSTHASIRTHDWVVFGILALGSILHLQAIRGGMALTRVNNLGNSPGHDLKSVWSFAGLLLLPPPLAVALVVVTAFSLRFRNTRSRMYRWIYTTAAVVLASEAAMSVLYAGLPHGAYPGLPSSARGVAVIVLAATVRWFVNFALVVGAILLSAPKTPAQDALGSFSNNLVEVAALSLGAVTALVVSYDPWYLALLLPLLLVLHRTLLLHQYEVAARTDAKTGLANTAHWSHLARTELARAERDGTEVGVLMLDLDHFKKINDNYGHLTGDAVLKAVADALRKQCREYDVVGRFGGEEFMVLVPAVDAAELMTVAERFRQCVGSLIVTSPDTHAPVTVTVSAGAVVYPQSGHDLDELLLAADAALYQAKQGGRNRCCLAPALPSALPLAREPQPEERT